MHYVHYTRNNRRMLRRCRAPYAFSVQPSRSTADTLGTMKGAATARYSFGEEVANSVTHGVGWLLSVCGLAVVFAVGIAT